MGVQTDSSLRDRRSMPQDDSGGVKRFKPTPVLGPGEETSLKIRFSRCGGNNSRQQGKPGLGGRGPPPPPPSEFSSPPAPTSPRARLKRTRAASSSDSSREHSPAKQQHDGAAVKAEPLVDVKAEAVKEEPYLPPALDLGMAGAQVVDECERAGPPPGGDISTSVLNEREPTPRPLPRSALPKLSRDQLLPQTPSVRVRDKAAAFSPQLLEWCLQRPISVIRGIPQACGMDLGLYTTKSLVERHPNHPVEIREQMEQSSDENWDPNDLSDQVWYCRSSRSHTTIAKYAEYLATSIKEAKERLGEKFDINPKIDMPAQPEPNQPFRRMIKFGTNCDLSDEKKWKPQIQELMKLPCWMRVVSAGNMLSHIGHQILGMNTIQLYMKVPCARTPGHQENNNFGAVNINIGPGDSEWFGVPEAYWGPLQELCQSKNVDYLHGSWWPRTEDLIEAGIPTYRFMQRPGEVVWVNSGCVHWVQAAGWCNNVAWNTGPLTPRQYKLAIERYEWNKTQKYQSIVAMVYLTWNMARNIRVTDVDLFRQMRRTMMRSIRQTVLMTKYARDLNIPVRFHGHKKHEPANYCMVCEEEVFNIFFVKENEKKHVVHCLRCARAQNKDLAGWICLEEYDIEELISVYDNFILGDVKIEQSGDNPLKLDQPVNNNVAD